MAGNEDATSPDCLDAYLRAARVPAFFGGTYLLCHRGGGVRFYCGRYT